VLVHDGTSVCRRRDTEKEKVMKEFIEFVGNLWLLFMAGGVMLIMASFMWEALRDTFDGML